MIVKVLGAIERTAGSWDARLASPVITLCGRTALDFTRAEVGEGETEVVIVSGIGSVEVTVPTGLPVLVTGLSVLGQRKVLGKREHGVLHGADRQNLSPHPGGRPGSGRPRPAVHAVDRRDFDLRP
jgi:hypothetical protein